MRYPDSDGKKRSKSGDRTNKTFNSQLRKAGAIVESDPYIRDADDPTTDNSCLDQLYRVFCSCLDAKKNNQVKPVNGYKRFEPDSNGTMGNGAAGGTKHPDPKPTPIKKPSGSGEKPSDRDKKHVEKFEYKADNLDLSIYPTETGNFEAKSNGVFSIPVEVESADKNKTGTSTGAGVAGQAHYPNAKAKENIEKIFKISDDDDSKNLYARQSRESKPYNFNSSTDNHENHHHRPGTPHAKYSLQGDSSSKNHVSENAYPGFGDTTEFGGQKNLARNDGRDNGWSDVQWKVDHTFNDENKHYKHSEMKETRHEYPGKQGHDYTGKQGHDYTGKQGHDYTGKQGHDYTGKQGHDYTGKQGHDHLGKQNHASNYYGGDHNSFEPKKSEDFSDSRRFVDNVRKKDESWAYPSNSQSYQGGVKKDKRYEHEDRNLDDSSSKRQAYKHNSRKNSDDQDSRSKGDKYTSPKKHESQYEKQKNKNGWRNSTEEDEGSKSRSKSQGRRGQGQRRGEESNSDEDRRGKDSRKKDGLILNPSKLGNADERDYRFSKKGGARGRGPSSAGANRRNGARVRGDDDDGGGGGGDRHKNAARGSKSVPNLGDDFTGARPPQRIEPLGKIVSNDPTNFSGNRSNGNHYNASTSIHGRTSHLPSMQQNDFMPLPNHAVNLLGDDVDFCNDDIDVKKNLSSSVPLSKSYDNLTHKNGSGENRFRYSNSLQRKQSETKSNKSSPLYPNTLQPFDSPKDALEKCLLQIESPEWEIVMQSLQGIVRLCRYHPEILVSALHRIVTSLSKQIRSLRSQVTKAACVVSQELFEQLGKTMDPEVEELAPALLSRTCDANKFLQHDANAALDSMIDNVTPIRSATFLLLKGAKHRNAVVRTTVCRLLARLCQNLSVGQVYALPRDTRDSLLNAAAKFLLEGSLETRAYAKELFSVLAREPKFMKLMNEVVPAKTMEAIRKPLIKIVSQK